MAGASYFNYEDSLNKLSQTIKVQIDTLTNDGIVYDTKIDNSERRIIDLELEILKYNSTLNFYGERIKKLEEEVEILQNIIIGFTE